MNNQVKVKITKKTFFYHIKKITGIPIVAIILMISFSMTAGALYVNNVISNTPTVSPQALQSNPSTNIYDKDGNIIWSSADNQRIYIKYEDIPQQFIDAVIAIEDRDFRTNTGYSIKGIANAVRSYVASKFSNEAIRGGSTIEQQLIKLSVFSTKDEDRTIERKIKELFLANQLYENYTKDEIFELYINKIYMGRNVYGAQTIAKTYFNKPLNELNLSQLATLAGIIQAPSKYDLYDNPEETMKRRNIVLDVMKQLNYITQDEYENAKNTAIDDGLQEKDWLKQTQYEISLKYPAFIQSTLEEVKKLGYDIERTPIQIYTTLDTTVQDQLNDIWNNGSEYFQEGSQSAITVADTTTGKIIAQVGGRNVAELFGFNRATNTSRSSGSTIKPFLVASAFQNLGWNQRHELSGMNYQYPNSEIIARNYENVEVEKATLYEALKQSYNTPMLRILETLSLDQYKQTLNELGFEQNELYQPNALGVDTSTEKLATAYATFANNGIYNNASYIDKILFADGSERKIEPFNQKVLQSGVAYMIFNILESIPKENGPFYRAFVPNIQYAAKTGTVAYEDENLKDKAMDIWTTGLTNTYSFAIWHGFDEPFSEDGQLDEKELLTKKANLFKKVLNVLNIHYPASKIEEPETVTHDEQDYLGFIPDSDNLKTPIISDLAYELYPYYLAGKEQFYQKQDVKNLNIIPNGYQEQGWIEELNKEKASFEEKVEQIKKDNKLRLEQFKRQQEIQHPNRRRQQEESSSESETTELTEINEEGDES